MVAGPWGQCHHAQEKPALLNAQTALGHQAWGHNGGSMQGGWRSLAVFRATHSSGAGLVSDGHSSSRKAGHGDWRFPKLLPEKCDVAWPPGVGRAGPVELATGLPSSCSASFCTHTPVLRANPSWPELPPSHQIRLSESPCQTAGRTKPNGAGSAPAPGKPGLWCNHAPPPAHPFSRQTL